MTQATYQVTGMHCASCATLITNRLQKLSGVASCQVNLATEKAQVEFDQSLTNLDQMNQKLKPLGYGLIDHHQQTDVSSSTNHDLTVQNHDTADIDFYKKQELAHLRSKVELSLPIAFLVFGLMTWDILAQTFSFFPNLPIPMFVFNPLMFVLASLVLFGAGSQFIAGVGRFIKYKVANMDTLIGLGTLTAYIYSSVVLLFPALGDLLQVSDHTYFDVTIVVIGFVIWGKYLEARAKLKTSDAIAQLICLQVKKALVLRAGVEVELDIDQVQVGDIVIVKPGGKVPIDGVIISGGSTVDESMITGESIPVDKKIGDQVIGATLNKQGSFQLRVNRVGAQTMLAQIIQMVAEAQGSKAPIERLADRVSAIFVPGVLILALVVLITWLVVGSQFMSLASAVGLGIYSVVSILVIACPCAMGLATPTAIVVGVGQAAKHGILIKNAQGLEKLSSVDYVVLDKTGTLTHGQPVVTDIVPNQGWTDGKALQILASLEKHSEHPLAQAVVEKAVKMKSKLANVGNFSIIEGKGLTGQIDRVVYFAGNLELARDLNVPVDLKQIEVLAKQGKTPIILMNKKQVLAYIALADTVKTGALETIKLLHKQNIKVAMLTGDHRLVAEHIADQLDIDQVFAQVLPGQKADVITDLQKQGYSVAMAGDGINDAPALVTADVGVAMATGTDVAIESADITLLGGQIAKLPQVTKLARATMRTIKQNLFWAFFYNVLAIPVAAGLLYPTFGILLNPALAGAAMAFSSVSVVANALRLKRVRLG